MAALREVPTDVRALLTDRASAGPLAAEAARWGFSVFPGHDTDVLARYCDACRSFSVSRVVRATGDNPLVCPRLARQILRIHAERGADLSHYVGIPWGSGVEVIETEALFAAEREAVDPAEREHITTFHYRRPDRFRLVEEPAPAEADMPAARVTVDTPEDYAAVGSLLSALYRGVPLEAAEVVAWLGRREEANRHG
jgi:spore coat polysaccharide biosynthesis protein SpsF